MKPRTRRNVHRPRSSERDDADIVLSLFERHSLSSDTLSLYYYYSANRSNKIGVHVCNKGQHRRRRRRRDVVLISTILVLFLLLFRLAEQLQRQNQTVLSFMYKSYNNGIRYLHAAKRNNGKHTKKEYLAWLEEAVSKSTLDAGGGTVSTKIKEDDEKITITMRIPDLPEGMRLKRIQLSMFDGASLIKQIYSRRPADDLTRRRGTDKTATLTQRVDVERNNEDKYGGDVDMNIREVEASMNKDGELVIVAWKGAEFKDEAGEGGKEEL